ADQRAAPRCRPAGHSPGHDPRPVQVGALPLHKMAYNCSRRRSRLTEGRIHLIGVKGTGMSALASLLHDEGVHVSGSDIDQPVFTERALEARGIPIRSFDPANVEGAAEVVHSASFGPAHPEVAEARRLGIPTYSYPQYLGRLTTERTALCVC